jgi:ABC-type dipeptide/oligopeptide/nickel transport system permease subunit
MLILLASLGPTFLSSSPTDLDLTNKLAAPSVAHPLGTDQFGRDELARVVDGARRSLGAAALVLAGSLVISLAIGLTAGVLRGSVDAALMRVVDVVLAFPKLVLALAVVGALGPGFEHLLLALMLASWAFNARIARGMVLTAGRRQDVLAARMAGIPQRTVVLAHILPGVVLQLLAIATIELGGVIIGLSSLSFLGLGLQPPTAEWGVMLSDSRLFFTTAPWLLLAPAIAILLSVSAATLIGDAIRDAADIRTSR